MNEGGELRFEYELFGPFSRKSTVKVYLGEAPCVLCESYRRQRTLPLDRDAAARMNELLSPKRLEPFFERAAMLEQRAAIFQRAGIPEFEEERQIHRWQCGIRTYGGEDYYSMEALDEDDDVFDGVHQWFLFSDGKRRVRYEVDNLYCRSEKREKYPCANLAIDLLEDVSAVLIPLGVDPFYLSQEYAECLAKEALRFCYETRDRFYGMCTRIEIVTGEAPCVFYRWAQTQWKTLQIDRKTAQRIDAILSPERLEPFFSYVEELDRRKETAAAKPIEQDRIRIADGYEIEPIDALDGWYNYFVFSDGERKAALQWHCLPDALESRPYAALAVRIIEEIALILASIGVDQRCLVYCPYGRKTT